MKNIDAAMELLQTMCDAMAAAAVDGSTGTAMPISIKVCIAIDDCDVEAFLEWFVQPLVDEAGCQCFYLHAHKVYTKGLYNPFKNRNIPAIA